MHVYIYDPFVSQKKYDSVIARIETRITDLGLNGKIIRLGVMNSAFSAVENEIKKGAKTFIAVGNDLLFNQLVNAIGKISASDSFQYNTPIGFIPIGKKNNTIASHLGIKLEEKACDVISARRIQTLDLGQVNDQYFLTAITIPTTGTTIEINNSYSIEISEKGDFYIVNLPINLSLPPNLKSSAKDGILEMFLNTKTQNRGIIKRHTSNKNESVFSFQTLQVFNKKLPITLDKNSKIKTPATIKIAREKINLIVGKDRKLN